MKSFISSLRRFHADENGAATVDWVVGTALAVSMTIAVTQTVGQEVTALADRVAAAIAGIEICFDTVCPSGE